MSTETKEKGKHTPGPWRVRYHPTYPHPNDFHVSAPTAKGHPYFGATEECEILSDEDYPLKEADARFIVRAVNAHEALLEVCRQVVAWYENSGPQDPAAGSVELWSACKKALALAEGRA